MIIILGTLSSANAGGVRTATVIATSGATGGGEVFNFDIGGQPITVTVTFAANETKPVTVTHQQAGVRPVSVTSSGQVKQCVLNLDAASDQC